MKQTNTINWALLAITAVAMSGCGKASQQQADEAVGTLKSVRTSLESVQTSIANKQNTANAATPETSSQSTSGAAGFISAIQASSSQSFGGSTPSGMHQDFKMDQADSPFKLQASVDVDGEGNAKLSISFSANDPNLKNQLDLPSLSMTYAISSSNIAFSIQGHSKSVGDVSIDDKGTISSDQLKETLTIKSAQGETDLVATQGAGDKEPKQTLNGHDMTDDQKTAVKSEMEKIGNAIQGIQKEIMSSGGTPGPSTGTFSGN